VHFSEVNSLFADAETGVGIVPSTSLPIRILVTDVFEKSEIVGLGTVTQTDFLQNVKTIGQVRIEAFLDKKPLKLAPGKNIEVLFPTSNVGVTEDVFVFRGGWNISNSGSKFVWSQLSDIPAPIIQPVANGSFYYQLLSENIGWISGCTFDSNVSGISNVILSEKAGISNSHVFLVLKDSKSVFYLPFNAQSFNFENKKIPLNRAATVVAISKFDDKIWVAKREITTSADQFLDLSADQKATTEAALKALLQSI
jgi:hypothetical protein